MIESVLDRAEDAVVAILGMLNIQPFQMPFTDNSECLGIIVGWRFNKIETVPLIRGNFHLCLRCPV